MVTDVTIVSDDRKFLKAHKETRQDRMAGKKSLEEQVALLQKQFGGLVKLVKDLKTSVEALEKKEIPNEKDEVKEILEAQKVIDKIIASNTESIKRTDKEINELKRNKAKKVEAPKESNEKEIKVNGVISVKKRCRYFNRGFCKYTTKCRFVHPKHVCKEHTTNQKCENVECQDRHPKTCKWLSSEVGCKRIDCEYRHETPVLGEIQVAKFKCVSCMDTWKDQKCVVKHTIKNHQVYFCLNCDDWVQSKENVFDQGWSLLGADGFLRTGL